MSKKQDAAYTAYLAADRAYEAEWAKAWNNIIWSNQDSDAAYDKVLAAYKKAREAHEEVVKACTEEKE